MNYFLTLFATLVLSHAQATFESVHVHLPHPFLGERAGQDERRSLSGRGRGGEHVFESSHPKVLAQYELFAESLNESFSEADGLTILNGLNFAAEKHSKQTRKDPERTPYIIHPMGVAHSLITIGQVRDPEIILAALLHDTVEDTDATFEEIKSNFGSNVEAYVRELTDDKSLPKELRKQLQIKNASHKSAGAAQVKLSDKLYNLNDLATTPPANWEQERIDAYFNWAKAVVDQLPEVNVPLKAAVDQVIQNYWQNRKDSNATSRIN